MKIENNTGIFYSQTQHINQKHQQDFCENRAALDNYMLNQSNIMRASVNFCGNKKREPNFLNDERINIPYKVDLQLRNTENLPKCILADIEKVKNTKGSVQDLMNAFIPEYESAEVANKKAEIGDVVQIGKGNVSIKTKDGIKPLNISKETYFELFPPITRYSNIQNKIGNCYEVTALNEMMQNPETRYNFLSCFVEKGKKLYFKFPKSERIEIDKNKILSNSVADKYTSGCDGFKIAEYAFGKELEKDFIQYNIDVIKAKKSANNIPDNVNHPLNRELKNLDKLLTVKTDSYSRGSYFKLRDKDLGVSLRGSNLAPNVWTKYGFEKSEFIYKQCDNNSCDELDKKMQELFSVNNPNPVDYEKVISLNRKYNSGTNPKEDVKNMVFVNGLLKDTKETDLEDIDFEILLASEEFFKDKLVDVQSNFSKDTILTSGHSYSIKPKETKNGEVVKYSLVDPLDLHEIEMSQDELFDNIDSISYSEI